MPRQEIHTDSTKIDQKPLLAAEALKDRTGDVVAVERLPNQDYIDALAFNEEPVTIRLEPTAEKNAATSHPIWVNGKGCEVLENDRWVERIYLSVGLNYTIKRKYVEVLIRAKIDTVHTDILEKDSETPNNVVKRFTSAVHSFSIIEDKNPLGVPWLQELRRRNF